MPHHYSRIALLALGLVGAIGVLALDASGTFTSPGAQGTTWPAPANVPAHVTAAGLQLLGKEGLAEHIHPHLTVTLNGQQVKVPAHLGINITAKPVTYAQIHTHDNSGIIHVESPTVEPFYLGQVFEEWGVPLNGNQVGPYVRDTQGVRIQTFIGAVPYPGDPQYLQLQNKQQLTVAITTDGSAPRPAPTFIYPAGY